MVGWLLGAEEASERARARAARIFFDCKSLIEIVFGASLSWTLHVQQQRSMRQHRALTYTESPPPVVCY